MIDFACKQFQLDDVIKCSLTLSKADFKLLRYMMEHDEDYFTTHELSKELGLNLTTIQRSVKKLHEKEIIMRGQENLSGGGYLFKYTIADKREIRKIIGDIVMNWAKNVQKALEKW
ncbi:winged helix-turn-helix transcriptional regulator [Candidatus Woesearchaeota archaeon]|nr:winged helix-turn-helix transcriptional regulator [Candidatus Woesearchaeota archaeon]